MPDRVRAAAGVSDRFPRIYTLAWLAVTLGIAMRLVPILESNPRRFRRLVQATFPVALSIVIVLAASPWVSDHLKRSRKSARAVAAAGLAQCPLDRARHGRRQSSRAFGYGRPTSNTLVELADRGIRVQRRAGRLFLDLAFPCNYIHRTMDA